MEGFLITSGIAIGFMSLFVIWAKLEDFGIIGKKA